MQNVNVDQLANLPSSNLRPVLPCLVRMSLCAPLDTSDNWTHKKKKILQCLSGVEVINSLVSLLSIDFHALEQDARKEQMLRKKAGGSHTESLFIAELEQGIALEFERTDAARKLRLVVSEILFIVDQVRDSNSEFYHKSCELFDNEVYFDEVSDVLCIAQAELPNLMTMTDVAEALMHVDNGVWFLCRLVCNVPDSFYQVCEYLVMTGSSQDDNSLSCDRRRQAILALCDMNTSMISTIQDLCVSCRKMPGLAVMLSLKHSNSSDVSMSDTTDMGGGQQGLSSAVLFVCGLLLGNDQDIRQWFAHHIKASLKKKDNNELSSIHLLRAELLSQLHRVIAGGTVIQVEGTRSGQRLQLTEQLTLQACTLIRLYAALKSIATVKFTEQEIAALLQLIMCSPPLSSTGNQFIILSLALLIACPHILGSHEQERHAIDWLRWLIKVAPSYKRVSETTGSFGEMLLLIAIHFHSNQTLSIVDTVSSILGIKSAVKANALSRMKTIFTQDVFTEQVVSSHAIQVAVTESLSSAHLGYLPIHCVHQLLSSRAFSKHNVPIKSWIYKQLCTCSTPLHPLVAPLIEVYTQSVILPNSKTNRCNERIDEHKILNVFDGLISGISHPKKSTEPATATKQQSPDKLTTQLLMLYYVMLYEDIRQNNRQAAANSNVDVPPYSPQLLANIPIKYLLGEAQKSPHLYAGLYSPLTRLLVSQYPHLCLVEDWLDEELLQARQKSSVVHVPGLNCAPHRLLNVLATAGTSPGEAMLVLERLMAVKALDLLPYMDVLCAGLSHMLNPDVPRAVQELVKDVWLRVNAVMPRKLRVKTVNSLCGAGAQYTEDDLTLDPVLVLKCQHVVFRCPPMLEILLRVLEAYMYASRCYLNTQLQSVSTDAVDVLEQSELKSALISAQDSVIAQLLIEICLPENDTEANTTSKLSALREVQCLVCSRLHQMFITDPALVKLIHFQGYPEELLKVTVRNIPSMHICLDFIPELLSQPDQQKQIFAIMLVSHLSEQYALPKTLSVAELTINVMTTLLTVLPARERGEFFLTTLSSLHRISDAFPPLTASIVSLLSQLGRIAMSHISSDEDVISSDTQACQTEHQPINKKEVKKSADMIDVKKPGITGLTPTAADIKSCYDIMSTHRRLYCEIQCVFSDVISTSTLLRSLYGNTLSIT